MCATRFNVPPCASLRCTFKLSINPTSPGWRLAASTPSTYTSKAACHRTFHQLGRTHLGETSRRDERVGFTRMRDEDPVAAAVRR